MSTMTELYEAGVCRMRLPFWNQHAYVEVPAEGPWAKLFDLLAGVGGGEPVDVLIAQCDMDTRWEPAHRAEARELGMVEVNPDAERTAAAMVAEAQLLAAAMAMLADELDANADGFYRDSNWGGGHRYACKLAASRIRDILDAAAILGIPR